MRLRKLFSLVALLLFGVLLTGCKPETCQELAILHFDQESLSDEIKGELGVSIGISKTNTELASLINTALAELSQEERLTMMTAAVERADGDNSTTHTIYTPNQESTKGTLTIGLEADYAPFNWEDTEANSYNMPLKGKNGAYVDGYDVQVGRYLAEKLDYKLEFVQLGWEALIPSIEDGTINLIVAGMTDTEERRLSINFTNEYWRSELVLVVRANSSLVNATSLKELKGKKVVSQVSTVTDSVIDEFKSQFKAKHLAPMESFPICAMAVQNGIADAMTAELPVAQSIVNSSKKAAE